MSLLVLGINGIHMGVPTGLVRFRDTNLETYFFVGHSVDGDGDHTLYTAPKSRFGSFNKRTIFVVEKVSGGRYRIKDQLYNSYLFVGHDTDREGDH